MKRVFLHLQYFLVLLVCVAAACQTSAAQQAGRQTRDKYVITAKAGGINYVSGNVTVTRVGAKDAKPVTEKDNLEDGDVLTTAAGGRAEVLLSPGSYLRIGENSELLMTDTSLEHLRVKLMRGSAVIETVGTGSAEIWLEVQTPQTNAFIRKRGIYRINVLQTGITEFLVLKGRALIGTGAIEVKDGKMIVVGGGRQEIAKLNKNLLDSLDLWSRERAEYLASVNRRIHPRILTTIYTDYNTFNDPFRVYQNRGTWVYDPVRRCYVFVPGGNNASSPYGYSYPNRCCENRPGSGGGGGGGNGSGSGGSGGGGGGGGTSGPTGGSSPIEGDPVVGRPRGGGLKNSPSPYEDPDAPRRGNNGERNDNSSPVVVDRTERVSSPAPSRAPEPMSAPAPSYSPPPSPPPAPVESSSPLRQKESPNR